MFCFTEIQQCTHIKATGHRCGSPALKGKFYCYFHSGLIRGVKRPIDSQIESVSILENPESIQVALMHAHNQVIRKEIDYRTGVLLVRILNLAIRNGRRANFNWNQDEMVREVPNYGEQYLAEHPELDPPEPDREIVINKKDEDADAVPAAVAPMPASPAITSPAFAAKTESAAAAQPGAPEPALSLSKGSRPFFGANLGADAFTHSIPPAPAKTTTAAAAAPMPATAIPSPAITSLAAKTKPAAAAQPQPLTIIPPAAAKTTTAAAAQKFARKHAGQKNARRNNASHKINRSANHAGKVVELNPPSTTPLIPTPAHAREQPPNLLHADTMRDIRERINRARRGNLNDMKTLFDLAGIFPNRRNRNSANTLPSG